MPRPPTSVRSILVPALGACAIVLALAGCDRQEGANPGTGNSTPTAPATTATPDRATPAAPDTPPGGSTGPMGTGNTPGASGAGSPDVTVSPQSNATAPVPANTASDLPTPPPR
ncbi:MAG: hypothetical protein J0H69_09455 [Burkholderiales bacterium]|jgi:hypothetical protein|nr:hypothetical protein [Burkholderiales bacterium]